MRLGKVVGHQSGTIEVWKCLVVRGIVWFINLFNNILETKKLSIERGISFLIPICKN